MDRLEAIKEAIEKFPYFPNGELRNDIEWLISEIENLRLDNTYLQQRLQREVEK